MSSVLETIRFLTWAGVGAVPRCVFSYAWMTSAATPAVIGEDWLVPPNDWTGDGLPARLAQPPNSSRFVEHNAQSDSPGATTSIVRPRWSKPDELSELISSLLPPLTPGKRPPPQPARVV